MTALKLVQRSDASERFAPLMAETVSAGFPSPAQDYIERALDLNELIVARPSATFFVRASGDSMIGAGIYSGDLLVVDRSIEPSGGSIVIALLDGEFLLKRLAFRRGRVFLDSENPDYPPRDVTGDESFEIWGVVRWVIRDMT